MVGIEVCSLSLTSGHVTGRDRRTQASMIREPIGLVRSPPRGVLWVFSLQAFQFSFSFRLFHRCPSPSRGPVFIGSLQPVLNIFPLPNAVPKAPEPVNPTSSSSSPSSTRSIQEESVVYFLARFSSRIPRSGSEYSTPSMTNMMKRKYPMKVLCPG